MAWNIIYRDHPFSTNLIPPLSKYGEKRVRVPTALYATNAQRRGRYNISL